MRVEGMLMPDVVDTGSLQHAVDQLAHAVADLAARAGQVTAVLRLQNDVDRLRLDAADCKELHEVPQARQLEFIPDTPYDQSMWQGVDDEGLGGFHSPRLQTKHPYHRR